MHKNRNCNNAQHTKLLKSSEMKLVETIAFECQGPGGQGQLPSSYEKGFAGHVQIFMEWGSLDKTIHGPAFPPDCSCRRSSGRQNKMSALKTYLHRVNNAKCPSANFSAAASHHTNCSTTEEGVGHFTPLKTSVSSCTVHISPCG